MKKKSKKQKGFIAIVSLLIIGTISLMIAMSILKDGVENASLSLSGIYSQGARMNANICLEDILMRIKYEDQFSQNLDYNIGPDESCTGSIVWLTPEIISPNLTETRVELNVTGMTHDFNRSFQYHLKIKKHTVHHLDGSINYLNTININSIDEI